MAKRRAQDKSSSAKPEHQTNGANLDFEQFVVPARLEKAIGSDTLPPSLERPHVVILGAGASKAALPDGDAQGRELPLMRNLVEVVGLDLILARHGISNGGDDFEATYSKLATSGKYPKCVKEIEQAISDYFSRLKLPAAPTLYDLLVLSLRPKDVVATFNWDPLLWQALNRNSRFAPMPEALFLHGNVAIGYCYDHKPIRFGSLGGCCRECGKPRLAGPLLYPVTVKNYHEAPSIKKSWDQLQLHLKNAFLFTIFGYSAPETDVEAIRLLKTAWGDPDRDRSLVEVEIIDMPGADHDMLRKRWDPFICRDHYRIPGSLYDSMLVSYPRRSVEAMFEMLVECNAVCEKNAPRAPNWPELRQWVGELVREEVA